jgi:hypothetical protein
MKVNNGICSISFVISVEITAKALHDINKATTNTTIALHKL